LVEAGQVAAGLDLLGGPDELEVQVAGVGARSFPVELASLAQVAVASRARQVVRRRASGHSAADDQDVGVARQGWVQLWTGDRCGWRSPTDSSAARIAASFCGSSTGSRGRRGWPPG